MAMNVGNEGGEGEVMVEMNTTPLIDVMLVLLTLLIITLPIQTHAVKLDMPKPNQKPPERPPVVVTLEVDFDGTILWNGTAVNRATLDQYLESAYTDDPQPEIHLQPNRLAKYDTVAMVLADAQRIGVTHIGFTGIETMQ
ncbi:MAG: biopolymer transporter ExbD [Alphaproteobacteria bacterium]|nr:biopolymer transporter ExbD [Alphaproteobacteria bacterium]MBV9539732.1 biopolymer transporter ExbD [Alphaproteobacteria bacterium]MBV9903445.1 biopolymer transporter ExbD [Alphaproteobacteria bacterium]